jgi:hypothetical protein
VPRARAELDEARAAAKHQPLSLAWIDKARAESALTADDMETATTAARIGAREFGLMRHRYGAAQCRLLLGKVKLRGGDHAGAVAALDEAASTFRTCGDRWAEAQTIKALAKARRERGELLAAEMLDAAAGDLLVRLRRTASETATPSAVDRDVRLATPAPAAAR